jgi:CRP/FNR family cyclic AMP-dependent transcriptional regulator
MTPDARAGIGLLGVIPERHAAEIAALGRRREYGAGATLLRQGETRPCMHLIVRGTVRVERVGPLARRMCLAALGPGDVVGASALIDAGPASASATAMGAVETLELEPESVIRMLLQLGDLPVALRQAMAARLRTTEDLTDRLARYVGRAATALSADGAAAAD